MEALLWLMRRRQEKAVLEDTKGKCTCVFYVASSTDSAGKRIHAYISCSACSKPRN